MLLAAHLPYKLPHTLHTMPTQPHMMTITYAMLSHLTGYNCGLQATLTECYILGLMQGAFFIFHLLTKPFPSRDQPPIHLDHMTNHLTSHLTTHMTSHMPSSHS